MRLGPYLLSPPPSPPPFPPPSPLLPPLSFPSLHLPSTPLTNPPFPSPRTAGPCQTSQRRETAGSPWRGIQPDRQVQWAEGNEALKSIWRMSCRIRNGPQRARWSITTWTSPRLGLNDAGRISFAVPRNAACIKEIAIGRPSSWASAAWDSMDNGPPGRAAIRRPTPAGCRCWPLTPLQRCADARLLDVNEECFERLLRSETSMQSAKSCLKASGRGTGRGRLRQIKCSAEHLRISRAVPPAPCRRRL